MNYKYIDKIIKFNNFRFKNGHKIHSINDPRNDIENYFRSKGIKARCKYNKSKLILNLPANLDFELQKNSLSKFLGINKIPLSIIFTKIDKIKKNIVEKNIDLYKKELLKNWKKLPEIFITSSKKQLGRKRILTYISEINKVASLLQLKINYRQKFFFNSFL